MTRNLQLEFDDILKNIVNPLFKELGFKKNGNTFNRRIDQLIQVVTLQKSQWNSESNVSFTLNVGFVDVEMYLEDKNQEIPKYFREYDCLFSFRLGHLILKKDHWYKLSENDNKENLEIEIYTDLNNFLKPFLQKNSDFNSIKYLILDKDLQLAISAFYRIKFLLKTGEIIKAKELIETEYFNALNPEDYISKTIFPDGTEIIKISKSTIDKKYVESLKEIATNNNLILPE